MGAQEAIMTPEERKLVTELFDRLATLEDARRDPEAERLIQDGLQQAPNAVYALVQTALVQDEALKRADSRIRELEDELGIGPEPPQPAGFLDNIRGALFGMPEPRATGGRGGSVPSVRPSEPSMQQPAEANTGFRAGAQPMAEPYRPGGSFLGNAAAAAAGVIGGSLLLDGIRSMTGHQSGSAHAAFDPSAGSQRILSTPWANADGGDLARQAGIDHIGRSPQQNDADNTGGFGLFDDAGGDVEDMDLDDFDDDDDGFIDGGDDN
jgi:hypothetical protein